MTIKERKIVKPDSKGRVTLGKLAKNISEYEIIEDENGRIILEPQVIVPMHELWLYKNPEALASVEKGIQDSKAGKTKSRGSFAKYVES